MNYRGEIKLRYKHTIFPQTAIVARKNYLGLVREIEPVPIEFQPKEFQIGDVIGQIIIMPILETQFEEVTELSDTVRGEGGFGSTEKLVAESAPAPAIVVEQPTEPKPKRKRKKNA